MQASGRAKFCLSLLVPFLCACRAAPPSTSHLKDGKAESSQAESIRAHHGAEAALRYLNLLPPDQFSGDGQYRRLRSIAKLEAALGRWDDADRHLRNCLQKNASSGSARRTADIELTRFTILLKLQRIAEAEKSLDAARQYLHTSHDASLEPYVLHDEAKLLEQREHFEEALEPVQRSVALFEHANRKADAANARITLAWAFFRMGRFDQASTQYLVAQKEASPGDLHLCLGHLGNLAYEQRDFAKAIDFYHRAADQAKEIDKDYVATWLTDEAATWIELGQWRQAGQRNEEALAAGAQLPSMTALQHALVNRARIAAGLHRYGDAVTQLNRIAKSSKDPPATVDAWTELAHIHRQLGEGDRAQAAYQEGLRVVNSESTALRDLENKLSFAESAMKLNQRYVAGLMDGGLVEEAFETAEASRARMLRDSLSLRDHSAELPRLKNYRSASERSGTAYLVYWVAPERSYAWVISGATFATFPLPGGAALRESVGRFQKLLIDRADSDEEGARLFRLLVGPALKPLHGAQKIVVVPDGPLYGMNFETLRQGSRQARFWVQDATLSVAPSLSFLLTPAVARQQEGNVMLMGDAAEWSAEFPRLLGSSEELDRIASAFPAGVCRRFTQAQATPAEFERQRLPGFRYIHFATHAAVNREAPLESAIILSQWKGRGKLTARDVLQIPVHAELVSISACQSAGSRTYAGEGLVGLAWAFLHSGAGSVVAGIWDVNDYSSPLIMGGLYSRLAHFESAPEALRAAKLELLKPEGKYRDPYYWGPFLLYRGAGGN